MKQKLKNIGNVSRSSSIKENPRFIITNKSATKRIASQLQAFLFRNHEKHAESEKGNLADAKLYHFRAARQPEHLLKSHSGSELAGHRKVCLCAVLGLQSAIQTTLPRHVLYYYPVVEESCKKKEISNVKENLQILKLFLETIKEEKSLLD